MKRILLAFILSCPLALMAASANEYAALYADAAAKAGATGAEWAAANSKALKQLRADMPKLAANPAGFPALLGALKSDYGTAPFAAVQIDELTRFVMSPKGQSARRAWADALLAKAKETGGVDGKPASAPQIACFCLDELRWCGYADQAEALAAFAHSSAKAVAEFAPIVIKAVRN